MYPIMKVNVQIDFDIAVVTYCRIQDHEKDSVSAIIL